MAARPLPGELARGADPGARRRLRQESVAGAGMDAPPPSRQESGAAEDGGAQLRAGREAPLRRLIAEDFATHDRHLCEPGFWAVAAHRVGARAGTTRSSVARVGLGVVHRFAALAVDWLWGIHIAREVELGRRVRIWHHGSILLQARSIGDDVHIRQNTTMGPLRGAHAAPEDSPRIGDRVDIGAGVAILGPILVGADTFVGANSVVLRSVPAGSTLLGVPARPIPT